MVYTEVQRLLIVSMYLLAWAVLANGRSPSAHHHNITRRNTSDLRNSSIFKLTTSPSNKKQVRLFSRVGLFVSMDTNGTISGVFSQNGQQEIFELQSFGPSVVRIKHIATGMYVGMNSKGRVKGQKKSTLKDSYFYQNHEENTYVSFASYFHKNRNGLQMFLAVKRGGSVKSGRQTRAGQDSMQFFTLHANYNRTKPSI